jgi:peptidoglycan/xylan/chitin deacetylase (PgdA/CDA1 family)
VLKEASAGGIVLMHDGGGDRSKTVQALPEVIAQLRKRNYKFVTVPELMEMEDKQLMANKD